MLQRKINKQKQLNAIAAEIEACKICRRGKIGKAVAGEGSADAKIVFLGEAREKKRPKAGGLLSARQEKFCAGLWRMRI